MEEKSRLEQFKEFVEMDPSDTFSRYALAMEYLSSGDYGQALHHFEEVIRMEPDNQTAYFQAGVAARKAAAIDRARELWRKGVEVARRKGDSHSVDKMTEALELLG